MNINEINNLLTELIKEDFVLEYDEDGPAEVEEFVDALKEMSQTSNDKYDALYAFFPFITDQMGGEGYEWDSQELKNAFRESYRSSGEDESELLRQYYEDMQSNLSIIANDRNLSEHFNWVEYTHSNSPELHIIERGAYSHLFMYE